MDWNIVDLQIAGQNTLSVRFADGLAGTVTFTPAAFRGIFASLANPARFHEAHLVDGVVTWPGGLDLAPDSMYAHIKQQGQWVLT